MRFNIPKYIYKSNRMHKTLDLETSTLEKYNGELKE